MKTILKTTALVAALAAAAPAVAMTVSDNGGQFGTLASAVTNISQSPDTWASRVHRNQDNPHVQIVGLSEAGADGAALNTYLDAASVDLGDFQRAVQGNTSMKISLNAEGFSAGDVVAYRAFGKDNIRLYVDDIK